MRNKNELKNINEIKDKSHFIYNAPEQEENIEINNFDKLISENDLSLYFKRGNEIIGCVKKDEDVLFNDTYSLYNRYFTEYNFNIEKIEISEIINLCINIMFRLIKIGNYKSIHILYSLILTLKKLKNKLSIYTSQKEEKEEKK